MSAGNSIIARIGLDLGGLQKDLSETEKMFVRAANDVAAKTKREKGRSGEGEHEGGASSNHALGDTLDAVTGEKGWVMKLNTLNQSPLVAAGAGTVLLFKEMAEAMKNLAEANAAAREELSKPVANAIAGGSEGVAKAIQGIDKVEAKLKESQTVTAALGPKLFDPMLKASNALFNTRFETGSLAKSVKELEALEERRFELNAALAQKAKEETAERHEALSQGKEELDLYEAKRATVQKIAEIRAQEDLAPDAKNALVDQAASEGADKEAQIRARIASREQQLALENAIVDIKIRGRDAAIEEAKTRVEIAKEQQKTAFSNPEKDAAAAKARAAGEALKQAQRETEEHKRKQALEIEMAGFVGEADAKHMASLVAEHAELKKEYDDERTKDDRRLQIEADLAKNRAAQRDAVTASTLKAFDIGGAQIDAHKGVGELQEELALTQKIALERSRLAFLQTNPGTGAKELAEQQSKIAGMIRQAGEMKRKREQEVSDANEENSVIKMRIAHMDEIAKAMQTEYEFQKRINEARKNGNAELAASLERQRKLTLDAQIHGIEDKQHDRARASLAELAGHAFNAQGQAARAAQRLDQRAERERVRGHFQRAEELQKQSDSIKGAIPGLKNSDKQEALLDQQLGELKAIRAGLQNVGKAGK